MVVVEAEYVLPDGDDNPKTRYLQDDWKKKGTTFHYHDGDYYLYVSVMKEVKIKSEETENGAVLGVDLNIRGTLVVTLTGMY